MTTRGDLLHAAEIMKRRGLLRTPWGQTGRLYCLWSGRIDVATAIRGAVAESACLSAPELFESREAMARVWRALNVVADLLGVSPAEVGLWGDGRTTNEARDLLMRAGDAVAIYTPTSSSLSSLRW